MRTMNFAFLIKFNEDSSCNGGVRGGLTTTAVWRLKRVLKVYAAIKSQMEGMKWRWSDTNISTTRIEWSYRLITFGHTLNHFAMLSLIVEALNRWKLLGQRPQNRIESIQKNVKFWEYTKWSELSVCSCCFCLFFFSAYHFWKLK